MATIYTTLNITANQRIWSEQKHRPPICKYCDKKILFLKDYRWQYVVCDAVKKIVNPEEGDQKILDEDGIIRTSGRRIGWPVHNCEKQKQAVRS